MLSAIAEELEYGMARPFVHSPSQEMDNPNSFQCSQHPSSEMVKA